MRPRSPGQGHDPRPGGTTTAAAPAAWPAPSGEQRARGGGSAGAALLTGTRPTSAANQRAARARPAELRPRRVRARQREPGGQSGRSGRRAGEGRLVPLPRAALWYRAERRTGLWHRALCRPDRTALGAGRRCGAAGTTAGRPLAPRRPPVNGAGPALPRSPDRAGRGQPPAPGPCREERPPVPNGPVTHSPAAAAAGTWLRPSHVPCAPPPALRALTSARRPRGRARRNAPPSRAASRGRPAQAEPEARSPSHFISPRYTHRARGGPGPEPPRDPPAAAAPLSHGERSPCPAALHKALGQHWDPAAHTLVAPEAPDRQPGGCSCSSVPLGSVSP